MNKMKEVAALFGLELGEGFTIKNANYNPYKFIERGLVDNCNERDNDMLNDLLKGDLEIDKKTFKPKINELYWFVGENGSVWSTIWSDSVSDFCFYIAGNCFRTKKEAEANADNILKRLKEIYEND